MGQQAIPLLSLTALLTGTVSTQRFVTAAYAQVASAGAAALGVARTAGVSGDYVAVDVFGTALVTAGAAVSAGDDVQSDASGRAITAAGGVVLGTALTAASTAGDVIEVLLAGAQGNKAGNVIASNDVTEHSAGTALAISGIHLIAGGTGIADFTLAAPEVGALCRIRLKSLSSGSVVVTTAAGVTFDGTNNTATLDAANEELILGYKSATEWVVIENVGSVALSSV